jgi:hypothetical protein
VEMPLRRPPLRPLACRRPPAATILHGAPSGNSWTTLQFSQVKRLDRQAHGARLAR